MTRHSKELWGARNCPKAGGVRPPRLGAENMVTFGRKGILPERFRTRQQLEILGVSQKPLAGLKSTLLADIQMGSPMACSQGQHNSDHGTQEPNAKPAVWDFLETESRT